MYRPTFLSFFGAVITMMLFSFTASAASLSDIRVSSALNQNLLAEVTVLGVGDRDQLGVSLAPDSIWQKTGISPLPELAGLRFSIKEGKGGQVITIVGKRPLREPVVEFILQVKTAQGTLQRWYTLLLDPPEEVQAAATVAQVAPAEVEIVQPTEPLVMAAEPAATPAREPVAVPASEPPAPEPVVAASPKPQPKPKPRPRPVAQPQPETAAPVADTRPVGAERSSGFNRLPELQRMESEQVAKVAPERKKEPAADSPPPPAQPALTQKQPPKTAERSNTSDPAPKNSYGPVRQGETLYSISNELRPAGVTLSQTMAAIMRTNPEAFDGKSENLSAGSKLYIPPKVVMTVISDREAKAYLRGGRETKKSSRKSVASAPVRKTARQAERRRTTAQPEPAPTSTPMVETVDETLPIARTFPLEGEIEQAPVSPSTSRVVPDVPSKARAPRNLNPSVSTFGTSSDLSDIPLATTYPLDYVAPAPDSGAPVTSPAEAETDRKAAGDAEVEVVAAPTAPEASNSEVEQQRAAIQQRAEEARKLAESARAEIERVKQRQAELVQQRADQLEAAALQLEKATADKQALEALVGKTSDSSVPAPRSVSVKAIDPAPEPAMSAPGGGTDLLTAELTSLPSQQPETPLGSQQPGSSATGENNGETVATDIPAEDTSPASDDAGSVAAEESSTETEKKIEEATEVSAEAGDEEPGAVPQPPATAAPSNGTNAAAPVAGNTPVTAANTTQQPASESETDFLTKAKNTGQQAIAAVSSTASAAASAMNNEPAELAPTDVNNFTDPEFWTNYFDRLKNGNIQAHNPILWAVLLGLLLLWLLSRLTGRKEKFTEPKDYGDLDGKEANESGDGNGATGDSPAAAALGAGAATLAVSKDPIGDANFHIDYGMHAQALDIVRAAKPGAEGELAQQLLLKEADILAAQGNTDGLHMLSQKQSDNAELQAHIKALESAAESSAAEAAKAESEPAAEAENESAAEAESAKPEEAVPPAVEPLVDDLDSLVADDDLLMEAADSATEEPQPEPVEPTETNNLVDFDLDDLDIPEAEEAAVTTDTGSSDNGDDNSVEFDLDSLSSELDGISDADSVDGSAETDDGGPAELEIDESLQPAKDDAIDELEELTASLGGDDELDNLAASFDGDSDLEELDDGLSDDSGLDELAASLAGDEDNSNGLGDDSLSDDSLEDELLVEAISEPEKPAPSAAADPAAEISFGDVLSTQLDLARAYSDMGDTTEARKLLETVVERGSERQIAEARQLLKELG